MLVQVPILCQQTVAYIFLRIPYLLGDKSPEAVADEYNRPFRGLLLLVRVGTDQDNGKTTYQSPEM